MDDGGSWAGEKRSFSAASAIFSVRGEAQWQPQAPRCPIRYGHDEASS